MLRKTGEKSVDYIIWNLREKKVHLKEKKVHLRAKKFGEEEKSSQKFKMMVP